MKELFTPKKKKVLKKRVVLQKKVVLPPPPPLQTPKMAWAEERLQVIVNSISGEILGRLPRQPQLFGAIQAFPRFCAADIVFSFYTTPAKPEELTQEQWLAWIALQFSTVGVAPYKMATTNSNQESWIPILEAIGFEAIKRFVNPNSRNQVTIWLGQSRY